MPAADLRLVDQVQRALAEAADPDRAPDMQRYMHSAMPFLGVRMPEVRRLTRALERSRRPADAATLAATVRALWDGATHREHRYAASVLLATPGARKVRDISLLGLYEHLIRTGAWWDHVDETSHRVGELLVLDHATVAPLIAGWATDDDRWVRRCSIICQLDRRADIDLDLLRTAIDANLGDPDFFIRKAIGWALRQHARTDADWVRAFVAVRADRMSNLSRREALKHLGD